MGTDNLFYRKKEQKLKSLQRQTKKRQSYEVILIICEGEKTEPNYFKGLRDELQLSNIIIYPSKGSDP